MQKNLTQKCVTVFLRNKSQKTLKKLQSRKNHPLESPVYYGFLTKISQIAFEICKLVTGGKARLIQSTKNRAPYSSAQLRDTPYSILFQEQPQRRSSSSRSEQEATARYIPLLVEIINNVKWMQEYPSGLLVRWANRKEGKGSGPLSRMGWGNSQVKKLVTHRNHNLCSAWAEGGSQSRPCWTNRSDSCRFQPSRSTHARSVPGSRLRSSGAPAATRPRRILARSLPSAARHCWTNEAISI